MRTSAGPEPEASSVPRPVAPKAPTPWLSSTITTTFSGKAASCFRATSKIAGSGASSPRIEKMPSVTTSARLQPSTSVSRASSSATSLWR